MKTPLSLSVILRCLMAMFVLLVGSDLCAGRPQTIIFPTIPNKVGTDVPFALGATASSGLAVSYAVASSGGVATLSGNAVSQMSMSRTPKERGQPTPALFFSPRPPAHHENRIARSIGILRCRDARALDDQENHRPPQHP